MEPDAAVPSPEVARRGFLKLAGGALLAAGAMPLLASCGSDSKTSGSAAASPSTTGAKATDFGLAHFQTDWVNDYTYSGTYLADTGGAYVKQGFSKGVDILLGGPNVSPEGNVIGGKALFGLTSSETMAAAVRQGGDLKVIGALYQQNPYCVLSLAKNPIHTPADLAGKKIGVSANNELLWSAFLKINKIDPSTVTKVVVQFDPAPLANGEVDGFVSFVTNQPISLQQKGLDTVVMSVQDHGFALYQDIYITTGENLTKNRDAIVAGMTAEVIGRQLVAADPEKAVRACVDKYSKSLEPDEATYRLQIAKALELATSEATKSKGWLYMSSEDIAKNVATLDSLSLTIPADTYDQSVLDDVYKNGKPS